MFPIILILVAVLATVCQALDPNQMKCSACVISLGLLEQATLQIRLENALKAKCPTSDSCGGDAEVQAACGSKKIGKKICEEEVKLKQKVCAEAKKLENKVCVGAVDELMHLLLKKIQPDALCNHMNMCQTFEQCELFTEWPLRHVPDKPKSWPTERRLTQTERKLYDFTGLETKVLEKFINELFEKYILPKEQNDNKFLGMANIAIALMEHIFGKIPSEPTGEPSYDRCKATDLKCKAAAVEAHLPLQDIDGDRFSKMKTLRGYNWRGEDCDDVNKDVYPGRKVANTGLLGRDIDHNCNGIKGGNSTGSYEDMFCQGTKQRGLIMLGDSATAHFHVPPQWLTADGWNIDGLMLNAEDEMDFPMCSWGTGHVNDMSLCPFQDEVPGVTGMTSLYTQMRNRNRCMHNDYQNIGVNGARITSSDTLVKAVARHQTNDQPVLLWMSLIGNDVCNGHPGNDHMTTPEDFKTSALASLNALDAILPPDSYVFSLALFDGALLYDTMHNQQHPLGPKYADVYDWLNCLQESPCWSWLNSDPNARQLATDRAKELNQVYVDIAATTTFKNFKYIYYAGEYVEMFASYAKDMGILAAPNLIEKGDGFHPSQAGNALFAKRFFEWMEKEHPDALGPINPHNAEIDAMFFSA